MTARPRGHSLDNIPLDQIGGGLQETEDDDRPDKKFRKGLYGKWAGQVPASILKLRPFSLIVIVGIIAQVAILVTFLALT